MDIFQASFFDEANRLKVLTQLNDQLVQLKEHINFEIFRENLTEVFKKEKASLVGRKPYDVVFMFKVLILQRIYNLSDQQTEF